MDSANSQLLLSSSSSSSTIISRRTSHNHNIHHLLNKIHNDNSSLNKQEQNNFAFISFAKRIQFYVSLCLGGIAFLSVLVFLFLIPFVVDPAISTLLADYEPTPVTCINTVHIRAEGLTNCSWSSSCRVGCTREVTRCDQLYVNYSRIPYVEFIKTYGTHKNYHQGRFEWDVIDTKFMVNPEGCGYPPNVNCTQFARQYGSTSAGIPFPCYYSRAFPDIVVARYSWENTFRHLVLSIAIPSLIFVICVGILCYWYYSGTNNTAPNKYSQYINDN